MNLSREKEKLLEDLDVLFLKYSHLSIIEVIGVLRYYIQIQIERGKHAGEWSEAEDFKND
jgi:hypothetical protein